MVCYHYDDTMQQLQTVQQNTIAAMAAVSNATEVGRMCWWRWLPVAIWQLAGAAQVRGGSMGAKGHALVHNEHDNPRPTAFAV